MASYITNRSYTAGNAGIWDLIGIFEFWDWDLWLRFGIWIWDLKIKDWDLYVRLGFEICPSLLESSWVSTRYNHCYHDMTVTRPAHWFYLAESGRLSRHWWFIHSFIHSSIQTSVSTTLSHIVSVESFVTGYVAGHISLHNGKLYITLNVTQNVYCDKRLASSLSNKLTSRM